MFLLMTPNYLTLYCLLAWFICLETRSHVPGWPPTSDYSSISQVLGLDVHCHSWHLLRQGSAIYLRLASNLNNPPDSASY